MLDIKYIRENTEIVRQAIKNKKEKANLDRLLSLDEKKKQLQFDYDQNRANQNKVSKEIPILKKSNGDTTEL